MREQGRVPPEDITEEEESSNQSDPEPDLNNEDTTNNISHPIVVSQTKVARSQKPLPVSSKPKSTHQKDIQEDLIVREHITRSGRVTSLKVLAGLHRDGTQIRNFR